MRHERTLACGVSLNRRLILLAFACIGLLLVSHGAAAQPKPEYDVKAAFLLNFTKFIDWPSDAFAAADSPIAICILGKDQFRHVLDEIVQGETVNDRKLLVRRISEIPPEKVCQVVFIDSSARDMPRVLGSLGHGVLTVSDGASFIQDGRIIGFVIEDRRVRFDINRSAANHAGLKVSSRLLSVARTFEK